LAHQTGLFALNEPVDRNTVADLDHQAVVLARQKLALFDSYGHFTLKADSEFFGTRER
jgi:hypothetical protein